MEKGIKPDLDKVEVIREMPEPKTMRHVRGFIGDDRILPTVYPGIF